MQVAKMVSIINSLTDTYMKIKNVIDDGGRQISQDEVKVSFEELYRFEDTIKATVQALEKINIL